MVAPLTIDKQWREPEGLHRLLETVRRNNNGANLKAVRHAYYIAEQAHEGQVRASGDPYITHPLAVAEILADLRMDDESIIAALLHDVFEDTAITQEQIAATFGLDVAGLVEGVTKLKFKPIESSTARQRAAAEVARAGESLRKMLLAMARDFRVMVIKLADRLHNMITLDPLPPDKRTRIANETLDIYAPLAARLGIWQVKWQLEDLAFKHLHPVEFQKVSDLVGKRRGEREEDLKEAIARLRDHLTQRGLRKVEISGRPKHLYSIFNKMVKQGLEFDQIYDLSAMRVIVEATSDCYLALGAVHELFIPIPGLFYDYVAKPKPNGYQSLHTKVVGPHGEPLEVQIRTRLMHEIAEYGVAAHWTYKEGAGAAESAKLSQLRQQLFDWSGDAATSSDFLRSLSTDLFSEQVFVFTPKGDVIDLPKGATPVDFGFRVHTELGMRMVGSKVNGAIVPLSTSLQNGDVVELITRSNAQPSLDWLEFVRSAHARSKLRSHFRKVTRSEDAARGREALEKELRGLGLDPKDFLGEDSLAEVAAKLHGVETPIDVLAKVGSGLIGVQSVIQKLRGEGHAPPKADQIHTSRTREGKLALVTSGIENVMLRRAKCCDPIPGDEVVGYVTRGRGIMIHRSVCPNALHYTTSEPERLINLEWPEDGSQFAVMLKIVTVNRQGLLMDISTIFGESKTNVSAAKIRTMPNHTAEIEVSIDVTDTKHLESVMTKIGNFSDVISVTRMYARTAK